MDYIYGKLNVEKILKEYTADNLAEGTADISIDNTKNKISAKVNRTPGKLVITKSINGNEKKELVSFDGSVDKEINLDEVDTYTGVETETSKPTIDTENNTIKVDVKKTPGKIRFEKANKLITDDLGNPIEFDGSKDITLDIPETLFEEMDSDTFEFIKVDNTTNKIQASVLKVPHKLTINNPDGSIDVFDGSENVSVAIPENSIPLLVGTESRPINWYSDLQIGNYYIVTGTILHRSGSVTTLSKKFLAYKNDTYGIILYNIKLTASPSINYNTEYVNTRLTINNYGYPTGYRYITYVSNVNGGTDVYTDIYAPTSSGISGQILKSNGSGQPSWVTPDYASQTYVNNVILTAKTYIDDAIESAVGNVSTLLGNTSDLEV